MSEENKENEEIVELDNEIKTENEGIKISDDVVAVIAGVAVSEVNGVAGMAGGFAGGISEVFSGKKNLAKGIKVEVSENIAKIDPDTLSVSEAFNTLQKFARESTELMEYRKAIK